MDGRFALIALPRVTQSPRDPEREARFLMRHGAGKLHSWFGEAVVEPGARITIGGILELVPRDAPPADAELGYREAPAASRRIVGNRAHPLAITAAR